MSSDEKRFEKAIEFVTPLAEKWAQSVVDSIAKLNLDEAGKDAMLMWVLQLLLFSTPYPNRIIIKTLANIIADISSERALGFLDWSKRENIFGKKKNK